MASKRLLKEYIESRKVLEKDIRLISVFVYYFIIICFRRDNLWDWTGFVRGPIGTPYENRVFQIKISVPQDYPLQAPSVHFITSIFHPNIHWVTGELCVDILKEEWSPAWSLNSVCRAVLALLHDPNPSSPLNCDAANILRCNDKLAYNSVARMYSMEYGLLDFPPFPEDPDFPMK